MKILFLSLILISVWVANPETVQPENEYLEKVLHNLNQIKSATYISTSSAYNPYDPVPVYVVDHYYKEYVNPADTFVGASYVKLLMEDTTKMDYCYDGEMRARVHWDEKTMEIDSFQTSRYSHRPVWPPFFTKAKSIISYILETEDSISVESRDFGDSVQFTLTIYDDVVEFFGNRTLHNTRPHAEKSEDSKYDIWINKSDDLPYRIKRDMPHSKSIETCRDVQLNKEEYKNFIASNYFPDYPLRAKNKQATKIEDWVGKVAPDWMLEDTNNQTLALKEVKSKIVMMQFTGIGCGPCQAAIPFLKELATEYKNEDFEFVSIETWSTNVGTLKRYQDRYELNFKFLNADENIKKDYAVQAVPVFYILDENRMIRKVIRGYGKGTTDQEIRNAINELI